jgi:hypothetical protein
MANVKQEYIDNAIEAIDDAPGDDELSITGYIDALEDIAAHVQTCIEGAKADLKKSGGAADDDDE